ncbi:MAG: histidine kinase, partial [Bacteroidota bacterium]
ELPFPGAWCIEYDSTGGGGLWFGAPDGLYYFEEKSERFSKVAAHAIHGHVANLKIADSLLLVGDIAGLFVLNLAAFHRNGAVRVKAYNHLNGFTGIEPGQNSAMLDSKGNYWVLCSNQIAWIHKDDISLADYPARVRIFQVNQERVPFQGESGIELKFGNNDVTVRFEVIGFQRPLRTEYRWRLTGNGGEWSDWSEDDFAFLPKLPSGRYVFEVQSRHPGSGGEAASVSDSVRFQVSQPFYREPDFFKTAFTLLACVVVAAAVLGFFYRKSKRKERESKRLAEERERLANLHQIRALQAQLNPHFLFNLLDAIRLNVKKGDTADAAGQIQQLSELMKGVLDNNLELDAAKIADGEYDINLDREIELLRCYIELRQALHPGSFTFTIEKDENLRSANIYVPPMMIQPFVENAIRHGLLPDTEQPGHLSLRFFREGEAVACEVRDNGRGMNGEPAPFSNERKKDRLHGIEMVQNRANLLREFGVEVSIEFSENPGGGTVVKVRFGKN